jgi:hypothetical protein
MVIGEDGETIHVCYVSPRVKRELRDLHTKDDLTTGRQLLDVRANATSLAERWVAGWERLTPEFIGAKLGFEDWEDLEVDEEGFVPFSRETMLALWWDSDRFSAAVQAHADRILEAEVAAKKLADRSSEESSPASD